MDELSFLYSYDLRILFYTLGAFSILTSLFFSFYKGIQLFLDFKYNKILEKDFNKGISFNKFEKEMITFEDNSSFSKILLSGLKDFKEGLDSNFNDNSSLIMLSRTTMREQLLSQIITKSTYLNIFILNSVVIFHAGLIFFLMEINKDYISSSDYFNSIINNSSILIISTFISMYSMFVFLLMKKIILDYEKNMKCYIEGFLRFLHKEFIIKK